MMLHLVYNRMPHHGEHAGYDQLARHLAGRIPVERIQPTSNVLPRPLRGWLTRRSEMVWYDGSSLDLEVSAAARMTTTRDDIFHVLYGEDTYRYLASWGALGRLKRCKLVATYHQPPSILAKVVPRTNTFKTLDAIIAVGSNQRDYLASFTDQRRVFIVPHGVDVEYFRPVDKKSTGRRCLFVGQWLRDFDMLTEVIRSVVRADSSVTFNIVTSDEHRGRFDGLPQTVVRTRLTDTELLQEYQSADMLVLPLLDCTANNALLEGLACGLPVITTDVGGVKDYITRDCTRLVPRGDVDGMCEAIVELASTPELRLRMGRHSRIQSLRYDWERVAAEFIELLRAL